MSSRANDACRVCNQVEFHVESWILDAHTMSIVARDVGVGIGEILRFDSNTELYTFDLTLDDVKVRMDLMFSRSKM